MKPHLAAATARWRLLAREYEARSGVFRRERLFQRPINYRRSAASRSIAGWVTHACVRRARISLRRSFGDLIWRLSLNGDPVFAYGVCIGNESRYRNYARPGIERAVVDGARAFERRNQQSIFEAYNSILEEARATCSKEFEGLILVHEDLEIRSPLESTLRGEFRNADVAIVGAIGGRGVRSVRWDRAVVTKGHAPDAAHGANDHGRGAFDVDMVDGLLLALSPWAVAHLNFDTAAYKGFHGYDADICMQARAHGRRVRTADFNLFHHTKGGFGDTAGHRRTDDIFRKKWGVPFDPWWHRAYKRLRNRAY